MEEELLRMMTEADALEIKQKRRDCEHRPVHLTIADCQCIFCVFCEAFVERFAGCTEEHTSKERA